MIRGDARSRYGTRVPTAKSNFKLHRSTFGPMVPRRFRGQSEYVTDACARNSRKDCFSHSPISDNTIRITGMYAVQKTEKNMSYPIHMALKPTIKSIGRPARAPAASSNEGHRMGFESKSAPNARPKSRLHG
jgi:hypothetical protein